MPHREIFGLADEGAAIRIGAQVAHGGGIGIDPFHSMPRGTGAPGDRWSSPQCGHGI